MSSEGCQAIGFMLNSYLSTCNSEQAQELKELLISTISNIDNVILTEQKDTDSTEKKVTYQTTKNNKERLRGEKTPIDNNLAKRIYNAAKKRPKAKQKDIEKSLHITIGMIGKQRKLLYFMGEYRTLANIFKLGQLMGGSNGRRYKIEIAEDYEE